MINNFIQKSIIVIILYNDLSNIEKLEKKNDKYLKPYLIKTNTDDYQYDIDKNV